MPNRYLSPGAQEEQQHPLLQAQPTVRVNGVDMQLGSTHLHTGSGGAAGVVPVGWPAGGQGAAAAGGGAEHGMQLMQQAWAAGSSGGGGGGCGQQEKAGRQRAEVGACLQRMCAGGRWLLANAKLTASCHMS